jgi:hypothetical protein
VAKASIALPVAVAAANETLVSAAVNEAGDILTSGVASKALTVVVLDVSN